MEGWQWRLVSHVSTDARIGRRRDRPENVLIELAANSYDADATRVEILSSGESRLIQVKDDGCGMDLDDLKELTTVAKSKKRRMLEKGETTPVFNRKLLGCFGIGVISFLSLGNLIRFFTCKEGCTPIMYQRTRSHQKVSVIASLCVAPSRDHLHLYFRLHPDANINSGLVIDFLRVLLRELDGPIVLLWDRFRPHRAKVTQAFIQRHPELHTHHLPPYAPELNPVENVWSYLKMNPMANLALTDLDTLTTTTRHYGRSLQRKQTLLRSFITHTPLSLRLE